jgi:hypothetical protein
MVEEASAAENMKNPLLFPKGPAFPDPNDSVLVAPPKNDSDMFEQDCSNSFCL